MFCRWCGSQLVHGARFCSACGAPVFGGMDSQAGNAQPVAGPTFAPDPFTANASIPHPYIFDPALRLQRPRAHRMIAGVCAGLAQQYRWDLTWVRVLTVLTAIVSSGAGVVAYIVFWIVMPEETWLLPPMSVSTPANVHPANAAASASAAASTSPPNPASGL